MATAKPVVEIVPVAAGSVSVFVPAVAGDFSVIVPLVEPAKVTADVNDCGRLTPVVPLSVRGII